MFSLQILVPLLLANFVEVSWSRSISLSLNLSVTLNKDVQQQYILTPDMIRTCMRNTEYSMFDLNHLRSAWLPKSTAPTTIGIDENTIDTTETIDGLNDNEDDDDTYANTVDYDSMSSAIIFNEKIQQSIQCFAHCIYEQIGLVKNGIFVEQEIFRRIYALTGQEKVEECTNLDSENKCEVAYKLHLCYSKLKTMEAERRIREIIEYSERKGEDEDDDQLSVEISEEAGQPDANNGCDDDGIEEIGADSRLNAI